MKKFLNVRDFWAYFSPDAGNTSLTEKAFIIWRCRFKSQVQLRLKSPQDMQHQTLWILKKNRGISVATSRYGIYL